MPTRTEQLHDSALDLKLWKKLYYKHQQEYIRKRLLAIKYLWEGKSRTEVTKLLGCTYRSFVTLMRV
jgi:hypothetical protein